MRSIITTIILFTTLSTIGQITVEREDWLPKFANDLPIKIASLKEEGLFQYSINSNSSLDEIGNGTADITGNRTFTSRIKFPILYKERAIITGGLKYSDEQFYFRNSDPYKYPLYVSLNDRNLKNLGGDVRGMFHLKDNKSLVMRTSWYFAGDFYRNDSRYFSLWDLLKSSLAVGYAVKKDAYTYKAVGVYFGYTFGRPSVYPMFTYSKRYGNGMGLDLVLPQSVKVWKKCSDKFYVYSNSQISGDSYTIRLRDSILDQTESLQLRQSTFTSTLGLVRKISNWLWFEAEAGYSTNINFNLSETDFVHNSTLPKPNKDYLIKSNVSGAPYVSLSLFLSPSEKFMEKLKN